MFERSKDAQHVLHVHYKEEARCAIHIAVPDEGLPKDPSKVASVPCVLTAGFMLQSEGDALCGAADSEARADLECLFEHEQAQEKLCSSNAAACCKALTSQHERPLYSDWLLRQTVLTFTGFSEITRF